MTTRFKTRLRQGFGVQAAVAAALVAAMAGAAPQVFAQDAPQRRGGPGAERMRGPGGFGPEFRALDLTDDQRAQLRKIREARQAEFKAAGDKLGAARQGMRALIQADQINEAAIRAKSTEVAAAEADVAILNAKVRAESLQILTSEQQAKLKELGTAREGRMKQRRGPRGQ
jgi:protein CpxP